MQDLLYFSQQLINGLTIGSAYALIAIGYTMVYGIIGMINFAHGEIYMIGAYTALIAITGLATLGIAWLPLVLVVALVCAILVSSSMGWAVERVAYRPVRGRHRLIPLISAIGMSIFLQNYMHLAQGSRNVGFPLLIEGGFNFGSEGAFQMSLSYMQITIFVTTLICMTVLSTFISRSRTGRACRAVSQDLGMANLLGIDTNRIISATFIIGAALAAVAGLLLGMYYGSVDPLFGFIAGLKAFTAAVLGGIGSIPGAMLGGLILGIAESMTSGYLSGEYKDVISFSLLILILLFKPTGLLGKPEVEKNLMAASNVRHAIFCAIVTIVISYPILGLNLEAEGINIVLTGTDATTIIAIACAALMVLLFQLFRDSIMAKLGVVNDLNPLTGRKPMEQNKRAKLESWILTGLVVVALFWPFFSSRGAVDLATLVLIYVILALGLNVVVGLAGLLDLGYVAFYAVGAYTFALLSQYYGISFWMALPLGALLAGVFGLLLGFPVLRLRGDYLAIVTLGFGEIIRILLNNWTNVTGGPNGIGGIPDPTLFGMEFGRRVKEEGNTSFHETFGIAYSGEHKVIFLYLIALVLAIITALIIRRLMKMPVGRAWEALREDEIAARSLGLSRTAVKLSAFTIGAFFAGFAGTIFASKQGFISPESFVFLESAIILAIVVLGGMGSQIGVILAAIAVTILPELAREFSEYRMLIFGAAMVLMMIWRPQGLVPMRRLHITLKTQE